MSLSQVYYTSCRTGLRGSPGFQVHAATPGIAAAVLQQVERLCVYVPPVSAPSRPGPSELEQFPLALIHQQLPDGTTVVGQARYVGADYSGRFGNYFAHSLVTTTPEVDLGDLLPIQLWRSPLWRTTECETTELPPADPPTRSSALALPQLASFLNERDRVKHLAAFVTAVEQALSTRRRVVIVDSSDAVASWIAVACFVLPRALALRLTFNTYVKSPYQTDALVVGTTADSDFGFAPHEIRHTVFLFDFLGERFTPIEQPSLLGRLAAALLRAGRLDHLAGYSAFATAVEPELPLAEAAVALATFCRLVGIDEPDLDSAQIASWCAPRLARIPSERVGLLCEQLLGESASPPQVSAALTIMQAAAAGEVSAQSQAAVAAAAVGWTLRAALRKVDTKVLSAIADALAPLPELPQAAQRIPIDWPELLRSTQEPERLLLYVRLGACCGQLDDLADTLTKIGEKVVGPALTAEPVQRLVRLLAGTASSRPLLHGIAAFMEQHGAQQSWVGLDSLLASDDVSAELQVWALAHRALLVYFHLQGARARIEQSSLPAAFRQCVGGVASMGEALTGPLVDRILASLWQGGQPTFYDALQLVAEIPVAVLAHTGLLVRLVERLAIVPSAVQIELVHRELAAHLSVAVLREALGAKVALLDLFEAAARLGEPEWEAHLVSALRCAERVDPQAGNGVRRLAADRIASELTFPRHQTLALRAFAASSLFGQAYRVVMEGVAQGNPKMAPATVVGLLQCWLALEAMAEHREIAAVLLHRVLPQAMRGWGRKQRAAAKSALASDWAARGRLRSIMAARTKGWKRFLFFATVGLGILATGVALWIFYGRGPAPEFVMRLRRARPAAASTSAPKPDPAGSTQKPIVDSRRNETHP